jgi:hypothetical protein
VGSDRKKSVEQIASLVDISVGSCRGILPDVLNMRHVCEHVVPRMLTPEQKETRMNVFGDLIGMAGEESIVIPEDLPRQDINRFFKVFWVMAILWRSQHNCYLVSIEQCCEST